MVEQQSIMDTVYQLLSFYTDLATMSLI
jgi:hypothetical protein